MSRVILPALRSRAVDWDEVDERLRHAAEAVNGGLDRDNLAPGYTLPVAGFMERKAPIVLSGRITPGEARCVVGSFPSVASGYSPSDPFVIPVSFTVAVRWSAPVLPITVTLYYGTYAAPTTVTAVSLGSVQFASGTSRVFTGKSTDFAAASVGGSYALPLNRYWAQVVTGAGNPDGISTVTLCGKVVHIA